MPYPYYRALVPLLALALGACASTPRQAAAPATTAATTTANASWAPGSERLEGRRVLSNRASRDIQLPDFVAERRYDDVFRENGKNIAVSVEYGWDYKRGITVERVFLRDGTPYSQRDMAGVKLTGTDEEMDLAFALAREEPALAEVLAQPNLNFYGGFSFFEASDPGCGAGTRCVHVIVSGGYNAETTVAHAIVDLMHRRVVHPFYETHPGVAGSPQPPVNPPPSRSEKSP
jgi:hypothetical protein